MQRLTPLVIHHIMCLLPYPTLVSLLACSKRLSFAKLEERRRAYILSTLKIDTHYVNISINDVDDRDYWSLLEHLIEIDGVVYIDVDDLMTTFHMLWPSITTRVQRFHLLLPNTIYSEGAVNFYKQVRYFVYKTMLPGRHYMSMICNTYKEMEEAYVEIYPALKRL